MIAFWICTGVLGFIAAWATTVVMAARGDAKGRRDDGYCRRIMGGMVYGKSHCQTTHGSSCWATDDTARVTGRDLTRNMGFAVFWPVWLIIGTGFLIYLGMKWIFGGSVRYAGAGLMKLVNTKL